MPDGQGNTSVQPSYGSDGNSSERGKNGGDPERGSGGGLSGDEKHLDELLVRRRQARLTALWFISITGAVLIGVIISIVCLLYRLFGVYTTDQAAGVSADPDKAGDAAGAASAAAQLADISVVTHVLPALPIFSLSLFALLVYITLARFTKHFVSESTARESAQDDMSDDSVILAALDKVCQMFKQGRK